VADPGRRLSASCPRKSGVTRFAEVSKSSKRIAAQLYLSVSSVETHLAHVCQRHTQICRCQKAAVRSAAAPDAEATRDAGDLRI
jgi:DNA-binding NarL/FixJ family response regulator